MEDEMIQKFKTVFYFFNCYSQFDKNRNCFNDVYELDGIKWKLGEMWESVRLGIIIPYEGEIPKELVERLHNEDKDFDFFYPSVSVVDDGLTKAYTNLKSFIKFIVEHHNYCNGTDIKYEDAYNYYLDKYYRYNNLSRDTTITDLANVANEYYVKHFDSNTDEMDLAINEILKSLDEHHGNIDSNNIPDYGICEYYNNKDTHTIYGEDKLVSGCLNSFSIHRYYFMNQAGLIDELGDLCNQLSLKPVDSRYSLRVMHSCLARFGSVYDEEDYDKNKANSLGIALNFMDPVNGDGSEDTQFITYNLSSHKLKIFELGSKDKKTRDATVEDKEAIYNFLCKVKEKIDIDLKEKDNQKVYRKK